VATVASDGTVTGIVASETPVTITVTRTGTSEVAHGEVYVVGVAIDYSYQPLVLGVLGKSSEGLTATSTLAEDTSFTWTSDDETVISVSETGTILGEAAGTTTIRTAANTSGVGDSVEVRVLSAESGAMIWDGESGWTGEYGSLNDARPFRGNACFEGVPQASHSPAIDLNGYPSYRSDISAFDEIWFFGGVSQVGKTFSFKVSTWPNGSNIVLVDPYVEGGAVDTTWRLVRIPIADLVTADYTFDKIDRISFGVANPTPGHSIFVDEIWAVDLDVFNPDSMPLMGLVRSVDFGDVAVHSTSNQDITLTNIGTATLSVKKVSITGQHADEFLVSSALFSIEPGATHPLTITFAPSAVLTKAVGGDKTASLVLAHDLTPMGATTTVPLSARALSPAIALSGDALDFGSVPVGLTATQTLTVSNPGNMLLTVSSVTASDPSFQASPLSLDLAVGETQDVTVTFAPADAGEMSATLTLLSDATDAEERSVALIAAGVTAGSIGSLALEADQVTTSTVPLSWPSHSGIASIGVYLAPEPSETPDGALPGQMLLATLSGEEGIYTVEDIAPAVDLFLHVELLDSGDTVVSQGNVHARTARGPGADLDAEQYVQEVHMYAPDILQIVIVDKMVHSGIVGADTIDWGINEIVGDSGAALQAGVWQVNRQDGSPINVTAIQRASSPVGPSIAAPGVWMRQELYNVEHSLFLVLEESIGNSEILNVVGPSITRETVNPTTHVIESGTPFQPSFILPFSDKYLESSVIQVNQVGYSPRATKRYAYLSGWMGDGGALSLTGFPATGNVIVDPADPLLGRDIVVADLPITLRSNTDAEVAADVYEMDLSSVPPEEGTVYRVQVPGVGVSWPTQVSERAVFKAFYTTARGLTHNRWGRDLQPEWTEWSPRPPDHPIVFTSDATQWWLERGAFTASTLQVGSRFLQGGHHDAGDFDIRIQHDQVAQYLLRAYETQPDHFTDGQLHIPESGNGIPDLLDEALWSLAAWEYLQEADGGVRTGAESYSHPSVLNFADLDTLPYWTFAREPYHTMRVAGLFAQAARLVKPFDHSKAEELVARAEAAYDYAIANGVSGSGPHLFAAGELYGYTGDTVYKDAFDAIWTASTNWTGLPDLYPRPPEGGFYRTEFNKILLNWVFGYFRGPSPDQDFYNEFDEFLTSSANNQSLTVENDHAYRNGRTSTSFGGGLDTTAGRWVFGVYGRLGIGVDNETDRQRYINAVSLSADYVLGCNPLGMVWLSGLGSRSPQYVNHHDSLTFRWYGKGIIPGLPVYGPMASVPNTWTYYFAENLCYPPFDERPPLRRWIDVNTWGLNEFTVWQTQAPDAELFAVLIGPDMMPPAP
jgi:endoglucanase